MFRALLRRLFNPQTWPAHPVLPPVHGPADLVLPTPSTRPHPVKPKLLAGPRYDPQAPPPVVVREYEAVKERHWSIWNGTGLDGAIELYRSVTSDDRKKQLHDAYLLLLRTLADPSSLHRLDYHALPTGARPYVLGPYLGLLVGHSYPRLCWETSDLAKGTLIYIVTGGPADATAWRQRMPDISAWLGQTWTLGTVAANTVTLVRRTPLPAHIPFSPAYLQNGALFIGINVDTHKPTAIPFADMTSGTFIAGASGTGKSNALHILIKGLLNNIGQFHAVYLIDGKDGVAFNRYRQAAPGKLHVLWQEPDVWRLASELNAEMRKRNELQRVQGIDNATSGFIAVVIDECSTFTAKPSTDSKHPDNKLHSRFIDELTTLARRGRSTGLRLFISAQEPVIEQIPASVRANCLTTIAFRLPVDAHANAVFGQLEGLPADPRKLLRGRALVKNGLTGEITHVQFPATK